MKIKYETYDGEIYDTKQECINQELKKIEKAFYNLKLFCKNQTSCEECPLYNRFCNTKSTGISFSFGQMANYLHSLTK